MPFITLVVVLRQLLPVSVSVQHFQRGVARESAKTICKNSPAIEREAVLGPARRRDNAADAARLKNASNLKDRFPKELRMFEGLTRDEHVNTLRLQFAPMIGLAQDQVDILPRGEVDANITRRLWPMEKS